MKAKVSLILAGGLLLAYLLYKYGADKARMLMAIFEKMTIEPGRVTSVNINMSRIRFNLDVLLTNPTADAFEVSGLGIARLTSIKVYYDGTFLASAKVDLQEISIPANNQLIVEKIPVEVPKPLDFIAYNLQLVYGMIRNFDENKITCTGVLNVAGYEIPIGETA